MCAVINTKCQCIENEGEHRSQFQMICSAMFPSIHGPVFYFDEYSFYSREGIIVRGGRVEMAFQQICIVDLMDALEDTWSHKRDSIVGHILGNMVDQIRDYLNFLLKGEDQMAILRDSHPDLAKDQEEPTRQAILRELNRLRDGLRKHFSEPEDIMGGLSFQRRFNESLNRRDDSQILVLLTIPYQQVVFCPICFGIVDMTFISE